MDFSNSKGNACIGIGEMVKKTYCTNRSPEPVSASSEISSEQLALGAKGGDISAFEEIARRYEKAIYAIAATFAVPEAERDDLCQEGLIALYRAVCRYDESIASFSTFAKVCIKRAMINWIRDHVSHIGADGSVITEIPLESLEAILAEDSSCEPEEVFISKEALTTLKREAVKKLSDYEKCVFLLYLEDMNAGEIAEALGKGRKSVENALDRIRKKLAR